MCHAGVSPGAIELTRHRAQLTAVHLPIDVTSETRPRGNWVGSLRPTQLPPVGQIYPSTHQVSALKPTLTAFG